jgi:hypothetical protein
MTIITGSIRDVYMTSKQELVMVLDHPKQNGKIIREHLNVRQRDLANAKIDGTLKIGSVVSMDCEVSEYNHNGAWKKCAINIKKVKTL